MNDDVFRRAGERLGERLRRIDEEAAKARGGVVPLGMERVDAETEARRWAKMGEDEKRRFIKEHGIEHALDTEKRARRNGYV